MGLGFSFIGNVKVEHFYNNRKKICIHHMHWYETAIEIGFSLQQEMFKLKCRGISLYHMDKAVFCVPG